MHTGEGGPFRAANLESAIKQAIVTRTGGRIRSLEVEAMERQVIVRGRAARYYDKQLALQAVIDWVGMTNRPRIELNIDVLDDPPSSEAKGSLENQNSQHLMGLDSDAHPGGRGFDRLPLTVDISLPRLVSRRLMCESNCRAAFRAPAGLVPPEHPQAMERT
jgi:hypothetical protein